VPFISFVVMPLGTVAMLVTYLWPDAGRLLARAAEAANDATFRLVEMLADRPELATIWPSPPLWWILAWYGVLLLIASRLPDRSAESGGEADGEQETVTLPLAGLTDHPYGGPSGRSSAGRLRLRMRIILPAAAAALLLAYAWNPGRFDRTATVRSSTSARATRRSSARLPAATFSWTAAARCGSTSRAKRGAGASTRSTSAKTWSCRCS